MIRFFFLLLPLLFLCSCAAPTTRRPGIPAVDSYDMREIRRELRKFSYDEATRRRQRLGQIAYNIRRSTGQELCDRRLLPDIGVDFMRINRLTVPKWKSSYDIYREEHEDAQTVYRRRTGEIWIEGVYKNSANIFYPEGKTELKKGVYETRAEARAWSASTALPFRTKTMLLNKFSNICSRAGKHFLWKLSSNAAVK